MNKRFGILISISTILLVIVLATISILRTTSKHNLSTSDQLIIPTKTPITRAGNNANISNTLPISSLNQEQRTAISNFKNLPSYESDALAISYSTLTGNIYIEKKSDKADEELQRFLLDNHLEDIFNKHPELFKITQSNIREQMNEDEELFTEYTTLPTDPSLTPTSVLSYDQQRNKNQFDAFNKLTRAIFSFDKLIPTSIPQKQLRNLFDNSLISIPEQTSTPSNSTTVPGAQVGSYKIRVKYDWKEPVHPICVLQPGTSSLVTYLQKTFGSSASFGIRADCATFIPNMHSDGRAVDYFFHANNPDQLKKGNEVFAWLLTNAQNIGIQYIKFWRVQWSPSTGIHCVGISPAQYKNDMYAHSNHIHFELNLAGAHKETPFFTRGSSAPAAMIINQEICPQLDPRIK